VTTAVIWVPAAGHVIQQADWCYEYAKAKGYHVEEFFPGNWRAACNMLLATAAGVLIYPSGTLDPNREPRTEVALPPGLTPGPPDVREVSGTLLRRRRPNQIY
jgi:hypothetical protein